MRKMSEYATSARFTNTMLGPVSEGNEDILDSSVAVNNGNKTSGASGTSGDENDDTIDDTIDDSPIGLTFETGLATDKSRAQDEMNSPASNPIEDDFEYEQTIKAMSSKGDDDLSFGGSDDLRPSSSRLSYSEDNNGVGIDPDFQNLIPEGNPPSPLNAMALSSTLMVKKQRNKREVCVIMHLRWYHETFNCLN